MDARIRAEKEFKEDTQIMVATEAAGEGINLQFCWLMVNYDMPWNPNRLEQRMGRVHRYGQDKEVYIYNLVAIDTREGRILERLFHKLHLMKEHLGSDRVFDVIGDVLKDASLKDLIIQAISESRSIDDILKDFEREPLEETVNRVKSATMGSLATKHIDLSKIKGEQRRAKESRLNPEYLERFFFKAAKNQGIAVEERKDGFYRIKSVPFHLRDHSYDFKVHYGEVEREYLKVSFDKDLSRKGEAVFVTTGHPLMESLLSFIKEKYQEEATKGSVFYDSDGHRAGLIWFLVGEIKDGKSEESGRKIICVHQNRKGDLKTINPGIIWDLKPITQEEFKSKESYETEEYELDRKKVIVFTLEEVLPSYLEDLLVERKKDAAIKEKYGIRSLDTLIIDSETRLGNYEIRRIKGESIPEALIVQEKRNREDSEKKKRKLLEEIQAQTNLYPSEPEILAVIKVVAKKSSSDGMRSDKEIEMVGMEVATKYEEEKGRFPEDVSSQNLGYDIRSSDDAENFRYIEVKARATTGSIILTPNEWVMANRLGEEYWFYVVENAATEPVLSTIQNPSRNLSPDEEVNIVRYVVNDWKNKAQVE